MSYMSVLLFFKSLKVFFFLINILRKKHVAEMSGSPKSILCFSIHTRHVALQNKDYIF